MANTVFLRILESDDKATALRAAARESGNARFEVDPASFKQIPGQPFAYWVGEHIRDLFQDHGRFERDGRTVKQGLATADDWRYMRTWWEVEPSVTPTSAKWFPVAKGGPGDSYYCDFPLVVNWAADGRELKAFASAYRQAHGWGDQWTAMLNSTAFYFRPGLTYPLRSAWFSPQVMPAGVIISVRGSGIYFQNATAAHLGLMASSAFDFLLKLVLGTYGQPQYDMGDINATPTPDLDQLSADALARLAVSAWSIKRSLDAAEEKSHAFMFPALRFVAAQTMNQGCNLWSLQNDQAKLDLASIQASIDSKSFDLYGVSDADRATMGAGFASRGGATADEQSDEDPEFGGTDGSIADNLTVVSEFASWAAGISFGRFDLRLATGERPLPPDPDPFDPLPASSPGMLTGADGLPLADTPPGYPIAFPTDGILVDDPGHDRDVLARIHYVFTVLFGDHADDRLQEAVSILDPSAKDLRPWLRRTFFEEHIQRYSKSRRKAPIYWRLGTPSGSYSVWIYLHRFYKDTLHRVLNDHVAPKLRYESNKLESLRSEAGPSPTPSQRKTLDAQETFVDELRGFSDEVQRVAPLWDPDLDDGVVINASFLHRLFAHTRAWQKECESHWQKLQKGEYDWAHLAMRLWPERVVPKCTEDRSLAIAHGLEDVLWLEGTDGKWRPQHVTDVEIAALVQERTSTAVKDALRRMGETPEPVAARKARSAETGEPKAPKAAKKAPAVQFGLGLADDPTDADLNAVRAALDGADDGLAKADVLESCGIVEEAASAALAVLVQTGEVEKIGAGRGTKYRLTGGPLDAN